MRARSRSGPGRAKGEDRKMAGAPYAGLVPCATSAAFAKREKNEVKSLTKRLKNVRAQPARAARLQPRLVRKKP